MAYDMNDLKRILVLVLFAIPLIASTNIDCSGRAFHCVNSTHFMICVDLGGGVSTTIDDFVIPCPVSTVCHPHNIFECDFPKVEVTTPPLQVIGVHKQSDTSVTTAIIDSITEPTPPDDILSVLNANVTVKSLTIPEEVLSVKKLEVFENIKQPNTDESANVTDATTIIDRIHISITPIPIDNVNNTVFETQVTTAFVDDNKQNVDEVIRSTTDKLDFIDNATSVIGLIHSTSTDPKNATSTNVTNNVLSSLDNIFDNNVTVTTEKNSEQVTEININNVTNTVTVTTEASFLGLALNSEPTAIPIVSNNETQNNSSNQNITTEVPATSLHNVNMTELISTVVITTTEPVPVTNTYNVTVTNDITVTEQNIPTFHITIINSTEGTSMTTNEPKVDINIINENTTEVHSTISNNTHNESVTNKQNITFINEITTTEIIPLINTQNDNGTEPAITNEVTTTAQLTVPNSNNNHISEIASIKENATIGQIHETITINTTEDIRKAHTITTELPLVITENNSTDNKSTIHLVTYQTTTENTLVTSSLENLTSAIHEKEPNLMEPSDILAAHPLPDFNSATFFDPYATADTIKTSMVDTTTERFIPQEIVTSERSVIQNISTTPTVNKSDTDTNFNSQQENVVHHFDVIQQMTEQVPITSNKQLIPETTTVANVPIVVETTHIPINAAEIMSTTENLPKDAFNNPVLPDFKFSTTTDLPIITVTNTAGDANTSNKNDSIHITTEPIASSTTQVRATTGFLAVTTMPSVFEAITEINTPTTTRVYDYINTQTTDTTLHSVTDAKVKIPSNVEIVTKATVVTTADVIVTSTDYTKISKPVIIEHETGAIKKSEVVTLQQKLSPPQIITNLNEKVEITNTYNDIDINPTKLYPIEILENHNVSDTVHFVNLTNNATTISNTVITAPATTEPVLTKPMKEDVILNLKSSKTVNKEQKPTDAPKEITLDAIPKTDITTEKSSNVITQASTVPETPINKIVDLTKLLYPTSTEAPSDRFDMTTLPILDANTLINVETTVIPVTTEMASKIENTRMISNKNNITLEPETTISLRLTNVTDSSRNATKGNDTYTPLPDKTTKTSTSNDINISTSSNTFDNRMKVEESIKYNHMTTPVNYSLDLSLSKSTTQMPLIKNATENGNYVINTEPPVISTVGVYKYTTKPTFDPEAVKMNDTIKKSTISTESSSVSNVVTEPYIPLSVPLFSLNKVTTIKPEVTMTSSTQSSYTPTISTTVKSHPTIQLQSSSKVMDTQIEQLATTAPLLQVLATPPDQSKTEPILSTNSQTTLVPKVKTSTKNIPRIHIDFTTQPTTRQTEDYINPQPINETDFMVETITFDGINNETHLRDTMYNGKLINQTVTNSNSEVKIPNKGINREDMGTETVSKKNTKITTIMPDGAIVVKTSYNRNDSLKQPAVNRGEIKDLTPNNTKTTTSTQNLIETQNSQNAGKIYTAPTRPSQPKEIRPFTAETNNTKFNVKQDVTDVEYVNIPDGNKLNTTKGFTTTYHNETKHNYISLNDTLGKHLTSTNHTITTEVQNHANESYKLSNKTNNQGIKINLQDSNNTNAKLNSTNKDKRAINAIAKNNLFDCTNHTRGRYADKNDCRKFYTCIGNLQAEVGICPNNTVFSEINKQCTRNLSHCVRNNQFHCLFEGRFSDFFRDNIYYICVKNIDHGFLRYKLQCQNNYHLNKNTVQCEKNLESLSVSSVSENSKTVNDENPSKLEAEEDKKSTTTIDFECDEEGKFPHKKDCRAYFICTKVKNVYRRKLKKCASDEIYDRKKETCVESSSEC